MDAAGIRAGVPASISANAAVMSVNLKLFFITLDV
jgi:hypothetical protein